MTRRPFSPVYLTAERVNETRVELDYRATDRAAVARLETEFGALMTSVALVGSHGGFSGDKYHPLDSNVVMTEQETGERGGLAWSFLHANVGTGLSVTLENLAHGTYFRDLDLAGVTVRTVLSGQSNRMSPGNIKRYRPLPFEYRYDVMSPTVVVDVDFADRQNAGRIEAFRGAFDAWYAVATAGGFADEEFRPSGEPAIFIENELQITSVGMQVVYGGAQVGESGFNVLTNMLTYFHNTVARLERVEIA